MRTGSQPHLTAGPAACALAVLFPHPALPQTAPHSATAQSVLHPAGPEAEAIATLFWIMTGAGAAIWAVVIGVAIYAVLGRRRPATERFADRFILTGGVIFPTVTLAALLVIGLRLLPDWREGDAPGLRIHVTGEQFWWRIVYETPDGPVETANELHLPVGAEVEFVLTSTDVIHSFWIPALGGKLDMIPGRTTLLRLTPTATGTFRGVCAEYCGLSHALMALVVTVEEPDAFARWLEAEAAPAATPPPEAWTAAGCAACHRVRGLPGGESRGGSVGPDLTRLAARGTLAAGTLPLTRAALHDWIAAPAAFKPDARMPGFAHLPQAARAEIVDWLMELR